MAGVIGFEPITIRLTGERSTIELHAIKIISFPYEKPWGQYLSSTVCSSDTPQPSPSTPRPLILLGD